MTRLAIHQADIERYNLPPQRIKAADSRPAGFQRRFGLNASTVELDALPAAELRRRVEMAIKEMIDFEKWDRQVAIQQVEFNCIADFAARIKALPQLDSNHDALGYTTQL